MNSIMDALRQEFAIQRKDDAIKFNSIIVVGNMTSVESGVIYKYLLETFSSYISTDTNIAFVGVPVHNSFWNTSNFLKLFNRYGLNDNYFGPSIITQPLSLAIMTMLPVYLSEESTIISNEAKAAIKDRFRQEAEWHRNNNTSAWRTAMLLQQEHMLDPLAFLVRLNNKKPIERVMSIINFNTILTSIVASTESVKLIAKALGMKTEHDDLFFPQVYDWLRVGNNAIIDRPSSPVTDHVMKKVCTPDKISSIAEQLDSVFLVSTAPVLSSDEFLLCMYEGFQLGVILAGIEDFSLAAAIGSTFDDLARETGDLFITTSETFDIALSTFQGGTLERIVDLVVNHICINTEWCPKCTSTSSFAYREASTKFLNGETVDLEEVLLNLHDINRQQ